MLNRRILRIKAFKAIYGYAENPGMTMKDTEAFLEHSCEAVRDLYLFILSITKALSAEALSRIEAAKNKFNPTEEEKRPNLKFVSNGISSALAGDPDFSRILSRKKLSWDQYDVFLRHLYESVREKEYFKRYLSSGECGIGEDARLWTSIFENEFEDNAELEPILEELSIYWNDDLPYALICCCRTMTAMGRGEQWNFPELFRAESGKNAESDKAFVTRLVRAAYTGFGRYCEAISGNTPKWDRNRICSTDLALIICGLAEADTFPSISTKITINEYVEISKYYSTPESSGFVNGLLDKLINKH